MAKGRPQMKNDIVMFSAVCVTVCIVLVLFYQEKGWRQKRMDWLVEGICAIMKEFAEGRMMMLDYMDYCRELTGYDVEAMLGGIQQEGEKWRRQNKNPKTVSLWKI